MYMSKIQTLFVKPHKRYKIINLNPQAQMTWLILFYNNGKIY